jgi:hypothetical protein
LTRAAQAQKQINREGREMTNLGRTAIGCNDMSGRHDRMLASYLLNRKRGTSAIRRMMRDDIDRFTDLGAKRYATDLAEVLERFDSKFPNRTEGKA